MMPDNLLRPDNRLLGTSTGDFSLYGAQPNTTVTIARANDPGEASTTGATPMDAPPAPASIGQGATPVSPIESSSGDENPLENSGTAPNGTVAQHDQSVVVETAADPIPPVSGGSTPPGILSPTVALLGGADGSRPNDLLASGTTGGGPADLLGNHNFVAGIPIIDVAPGVFAGVGGVVSTVGATLLAETTSAVQAVDHAVSGVADALDGVTGQALSLSGQAAGALSDTVADLGGAVTAAGVGAAKTVDTLVGHTGDVVADIAGGALAIGAAGTALSGVATDATAAVDGATGATTAVVQDVAASVPTLADDAPLAGTDPVGGVATLVDLVQTSELFVVGQSDTAPDVTEGGSIVDSLIGATDAVDPVPDDHATDHAHTDLLDDIHLGL